YTYFTDHDSFENWMRFDVARTSVGTASANIFHGDSLADIMQGLDGGDTLDGAGGNDVLSGGQGVDKLIGGFGDDRIDGGTGIDVADYSGFGGAVVVNLAKTSAQNTGVAGTDTITGVENLISGA